MRIHIHGGDDAPDSFVPYGTVSGAEGGPRVAIVAGVHGTELVTQDAVQMLWQQLDPQSLRGSLTVVFVADVLAAQAGLPGVNPVDGRNLNRVWPGSDRGSYSERLAFRLWSELLSQPEFVIDVHGGEWTEEVIPFALVHATGDSGRDQRARELASQMRLPYLQTTAGEGTLSGAVARSGRVGLALEVGGGGRRSQADIDQVLLALRGVLEAVGSIEVALAPAAGETRILSGGEQLRTSVAGVAVPQVRLGDAVAGGQKLFVITDFDGEPLEEIKATRAGTVLLRSLGRVVAAGSLVATVGWSGD